MKKRIYEKLKEHSADNLGKETSEAEILALEKELEINLPTEYRDYLKEIGYAEIYGEEIFSIYSVPDERACSGLHWMNKDNPLLKEGFLYFFNSDIDGDFYLHLETGKVFLNTQSHKFADSFLGFVDKILSL